MTYISMSGVTDAAEDIRKFFSGRLALHLAHHTCANESGNMTVRRTERVYANPQVKLFLDQPYPWILITAESIFKSGVDFGWSFTTHAQTQPESDWEMGVPSYVIDGDTLTLRCPDYRGRTVTLFIERRELK